MIEWRDVTASITRGKYAVAENRLLVGCYHVNVVAGDASVFGRRDRMAQRDSAFIRQSYVENMVTKNHLLVGCLLSSTISRTRE